MTLKIQINAMTGKKMWSG